MQISCVRSRVSGPETLDKPISPVIQFINFHKYIKFKYLEIYPRVSKNRKFTAAAFLDNK